MKKIWNYFKTNYNVVIVGILLLASIVCLFFKCAMLENSIASKDLTGFNLFFGLVEKSEFVNPITKENEVIKNTILKFNPLCLVYIFALLLALVLYAINIKPIKRFKNYICIVLVIVSAIFYILPLLTPKFSQEMLLDDYKITIFSFVGLICICVAFIYIAVCELLPKFKKKKNK